ncbi:MAG: Phosphatidylcholine synthase, partial [uncultured Chloroflexi bacterium]
GRPQRTRTRRTPPPNTPTRLGRMGRAPVHGRRARGGVRGAAGRHRRRSARLPALARGGARGRWHRRHLRPPRRRQGRAAPLRRRRARPGDRLPHLRRGARLVHAAARHAPRAVRVPLGGVRAGDLALLLLQRAHEEPRPLLRRLPRRLEPGRLLLVGARLQPHRQRKRGPRPRRPHPHPDQVPPPLPRAPTPPLHATRRRRVGRVRYCPRAASSRSPTHRPGPVAARHRLLRRRLYLAHAPRPGSPV